MKVCIYLHSCISYVSGHTEVCHKGLPPFLHPTPYTSTCLRSDIAQIYMSLKHKLCYSGMRRCKEVYSHILNTVSFATVLSRTVGQWENGQRDEVEEIEDSNQMFWEEDTLTRQMSRDWAAAFCRRILSFHFLQLHHVLITQRKQDYNLPIQPHTVCYF